MKSKKRHQSSSEESEKSDESIISSSSSESDSEDSSESEHRHKKKRKRANSSDSDSASENQKRSKKRKHKKKKKKHSKKKRRSNTDELSASGDELSSISDGEISPKKKRKHKHKHSKRARSSSNSDVEEVHGERRLHSVVKEPRASSGEESQPSRTYYQKEYTRADGQDYERVREVQRFYRGSSKEQKNQYQEKHYYERERNDRYGSYHQEKYYDKNKEKYGNNSHYNVPNEDFSRRQQEFDEYKRQHRYNEHRYQEEYFRRPREDNFHHREDSRGYRYNQYEGPKRRDYDESREYRDRRGPHEIVTYREREYPDKREKYRDEGYSQDRPREPQRRERPPRSDKPPPPNRGHSRSRSPDSRFRGKRSEGRNEREESRPAREKPREERRSPPPTSSDNKPRERKTRFGDANEQEYSWGKTEVKKEGTKDPGDKEKPNFGLSGKLTADQNTVNGVVVKYTEPDDAKQPKRRWRFYPFKGDKAMPILYIHRQSAFLIGRDKKVADIPLDHPSISKQHAALQYRATPFTRPDGTQGRRVRPYIIDLESANGTFVNNKKLEPRRYVELLERDVVKFGFSQREYVLLHENSKDEAQDDDHFDPPDIGDNVTTTEQLKQEKRVKQELAEDGE